MTEPTGCASILIDSQGRNMIAVAAGANLGACSDIVDDGPISKASAVVMQMENDPAQIEGLMRRVRNVGGRSILNLAPAFLLGRESLSSCDLIIVNEDEAEALAGWMACDPSVQDLSTCLNITDTVGAMERKPLLTAKGFLLLHCWSKSATLRQLGDCFVGVLASALDRVLSNKAAVGRAVTAAGISCSRGGSQSSIPFAAETDQWRLQA
ncbi:hypothetical protein NKH69_34165 [Mesorhizobium sp. M0976]|uniref:hypothetical protein n=1 Tax=Mesorhizobium sp. M0976 TaxID=2957038 RepID=UPI00333AD421